MSDFSKSLIKDVLIAAGLAAVILTFIRPTIVKQSSMEATLQENDYLIMYKLAYLSGEPERGDIIIFKSNILDENGKKKLLIKRVIGTPGDTIAVHDNQLYVNGKAYKEDYLKDGITTGTVEETKIPKDKYFVMGDNRVVSVDSRFPEVGLVPKDTIKGKIVVRLFPFNEIETY